MIEHPVLRPELRAHVADAEQTLVWSERSRRVLEGTACAAIMSLLNGKNTVGDIVATLEKRIAPAQVLHTLNELAREGYIIDRQEATGRPEQIFWSLLDAEMKADGTGPENLPVVQITPLGDGITGTPIRAACEAMGFVVGSQGNMEVVVTNSYLHEGLGPVNTRALLANRPYLMVKPVGTIFWIGPLVIPFETACGACLQHRLRINRATPSILNQTDNGTPIPAFLPTTLQMALHMAVIEMAKYIRWGRSPTLESTLVSFDSLHLKTQHHAVVRVPQCPACGTLASPKPPPLHLQSRKKIFTQDGGHRSVAPAETFARYAHHISPITGIIHHVNRASGITSDTVHVYTTGYSQAASTQSTSAFPRSTRETSMGKGRSASQAQASALCEALERISGRYRGNEFSRLGTYQALGSDAIHPNECMLFSQAQYHHQATTHQGGVPEPFEEDVEMAWTPVWSLTNEGFKYLPTAFCYMAYPEVGRAYCRPDYNGNAAGNTLEEAILQGFMEVVERDGVALWWYNRVQRPAVDLDSFEEPYFVSLKKYYHSVARDFWVLDVTTDLAIPTFVAISRSLYAPQEPLLYGFGTHFDARLALLRALTEMNQALPILLDMRARGEQFADHDKQATMIEWATARLEEHPYLLPNMQSATKQAIDYPNVSHNDLLEDVKLCAKITGDKGMEMLVIDQTRPDIGLCVVKVIVPGLRPPWRRLAPGRLYEIPARLDWVPESLKESMMNSAPITK